MNVDQFKAEYEFLTIPRQVAGLQTLFNLLIDDVNTANNNYHDLILDILDLADMAEANDYFGTEGLNI